MLLDRNKIHPSIFLATDKFVSNATWSGGVGLSAEQKKASTEHTAVWMSENGKGCGAAIAGYAVLFLGIIALKPVIGQDHMKQAILAFFAIGIAIFYFGYQFNKRRITIDEFRALVPGLELTSTQRAYAEAAMVLSEIPLHSATKDDLWAQLNRLVDEEARLLAVRARGAVVETTPDAIAAERGEILSRLDAATDPVSRDALQRSLEICESRFRASRDLSLVVQRVDAQLELISQSMRSMRDTLLRLQSVPAETGVGIDLTPLRETVEHAHRHAVALEAAVGEVQTLA
ncbi:hypothetical protein [Fimbriimonas ginsengisoli]|uniref:Uncharacterized protein n=1 Tax=Fimbriimonas ginsengisoli Gsoil 348 TaxID=661478 RepID=A0A068NVJ2_FIMGI|nr:hypothetical protein [Fimbriimonas ginsengisoli]AIE86810.1 hypothetical protein OP10G_3442 [Fimbriimonas ginsengisoli Gsoil 348]